MAILACNEGGYAETVRSPAPRGDTAIRQHQAHLRQPAHPPCEHHGGLAASIFRAAPISDLTQPQQDSVAEIEASLKADDDGLRAAMKAFSATA